MTNRRRVRGDNLIMTFAALDCTVGAVAGESVATQRVAGLMHEATLCVIHKLLFWVWVSCVCELINSISLAIITLMLRGCKLAWLVLEIQICIFFYLSKFLKAGNNIAVSNMGFTANLVWV
uniref:SFRICE_014925 n=1 Tax=Spodoptera frugiperda TaxID=7108 RepID=A0A2H1W3L2_SPOFR